MPDTRGGINMMACRQGRRGWTSTDYVAVVSVVTMAAVATQGALQRTVQAKIKLATDEIFAITPADRTAPMAKRGEETQKAGIETHDPGSGLGGGNTISSYTTTRESRYTERRTGKGTATITRSGLIERTDNTGSWIANDDQYVGPEFLRRPRGLDSFPVVKLPQGGRVPEAPIVDRPITPPGPDSGTSPTPGQNPAPSGSTSAARR